MRGAGKVGSAADHRLLGPPAGEDRWNEAWLGLAAHSGSLARQEGNRFTGIRFTQSESRHALSYDLAECQVVIAIATRGLDLWCRSVLFRLSQEGIEEPGALSPARSRFTAKIHTDAGSVAPGQQRNQRWHMGQVGATAQPWWQCRGR